MASAPPFNPLIGLLQNQPTDPNNLNPTRFRLVMRRAPNCVYNVQQCNLPAFGVGNPLQPTPFLDVPRVGGKVKYEDFYFSFPVDEEMKNYKEIADWIVGEGSPKQFGQYKDLDTSMDGTWSDIGLIILDSQQNPLHVVKIVNAFPTHLSEILFDATVTDIKPIVVTATFKYSYWQFESVNRGTKTQTEADLEHE